MNRFFYCEALNKIAIVRGTSRSDVLYGSVLEACQYNKFTEVSFEIAHQFIVDNMTETKCGYQFPIIEVTSE